VGYNSVADKTGLSSFVTCQITRNFRCIDA